jgi:hypothetical protein
VLKNDPSASLARRELLGITTLIVRVQWPGMDQPTVRRSIRLPGEEVLPTVV